MSAVSLEPGFPRDRAAWSRLAEESTNVFLTPEWLESWWAHAEPRHEPITATGLGAGGAPDWLAVLEPSRVGPLRCLRFAGHGPADELGPICTPALRPAAGGDLVRAIRERGAWDVLICEQLAGDVDWQSLLDARAIDSIPSPVVRFEHPTWEAFLAARTTKLRSQLRRDQRGVDDAGPSRIDLADDSDRVDEVMHVLFAMHRDRWGDDSGFLAGGAEPFHRNFAQLALRKGWLRLFALEVNGAIQAVWYGFRFAGCDAHYQSGRSAGCPAGGGSLLVTTAIRAALEDGLSEYRFLRGGEAYKLRWATGGYDLQTLVSGVTRSGRAAATLAARANGRGLKALAGKAARRAVLA